MLIWFFVSLVLWNNYIMIFVAHIWCCTICLFALCQYVPHVPSLCFSPWLVSHWEVKTWQFDEQKSKCDSSWHLKLLHTLRQKLITYLNLVMSFWLRLLPKLKQIKDALPCLQSWELTRALPSSVRDTKH